MLALVLATWGFLGGWQWFQPDYSFQCNLKSASFTIEAPKHPKEMFKETCDLACSAGRNCKSIGHAASTYSVKAPYKWQVTCICDDRD